MTTNEASTERWKIQYAALVNVSYYETLYGVFSVMRTVARLVTITLAIISVVLSYADLDGVFFSTTALAVTILFDMLAISKMASYLQSLRQRWAELDGDCRQLKIAMASCDEGPIDKETRQALSDLQAKKSGIDRDETWVVIGWLLSRCQRNLNRRRYNVESGSIEEVIAKVGKPAIYS